MQMKKEHHILVVDDEEELRTSLSDNLWDAGYEVVTASEGKEALSILKKTKVDLVILDIKMPGMSGIDVLKVITKEFASTKVIMLTAHSNLKHAIESRENGAVDFIPKPFDTEDILSSIARALG